jgi:hypothetical protein
VLFIEFYRPSEIVDVDGDMIDALEHKRLLSQRIGSGCSVCKQ